MMSPLLLAGREYISLNSLGRVDDVVSAEPKNSQHWNHRSRILCPIFSLICWFHWVSYFSVAVATLTTMRDGALPCHLDWWRYLERSLVQIGMVSAQNLESLVPDLLWSDSITHWHCYQKSSLKNLQGRSSGCSPRIPL